MLIHIAYSGLSKKADNITPALDIISKDQQHNCCHSRLTCTEKQVLLHQDESRVSFQPLSWECLALCQILTLLDTSDQYAELNQLGLSSHYNLCKHEFGAVWIGRKRNESVFSVLVCS